MDPTALPSSERITAWGVTVAAVLVTDASLVLRVAGGSWGGERPTTVWASFDDEASAEAAAAAFRQLQGILSGTDLAVDATGRILAAGGYLSGVWHQIIGSGPTVYLAEEGLLSAVLEGVVHGLVFCSTITAVKDRFDRIGVTVEGGRIAVGDISYSLVEQTAEAWFQLPDQTRARALLTAGVGEVGQVWLISDGNGRCFAVQDVTGNQNDRRVLFSMNSR